MRIAYRLEAEDDRREIRLYYNEISRRTADNVYKDIVAAINVLKDFPEVGRDIGGGRRRFTSSKYRFVISHRLYDDYIDLHLLKDSF